MLVAVRRVAVPRNLLPSERCTESKQAASQSIGRKPGEAAAEDSGHLPLVQSDHVRRLVLRKPATFHGLRDLPSEARLHERLPGIRQPQIREHVAGPALEPGGFYVRMLVAAHLTLLLS